MYRGCSRWDSRLHRRHRRRSGGNVPVGIWPPENSVRNAVRSDRSYSPAGLARPAERQKIPENSAWNAARQSRLPRTAGSVLPVESRTKENSAQNAVRKNRPVCRSINVINAAGNRRNRRIRQSSVRNAEIRLTTGIFSNGKRYPICGCGMGVPGRHRCRREREIICDPG